MGNLLGYINEFKDTTFAKAAFTEADNLALCQLAYCDLSDTVSMLGAHSSITLPQAWKIYSRERKASFRKAGLTSSERVFEALASARRYAGVRLAWFDEYSDDSRHVQFAAFTALLPDGSAYVAYRGTDNRISAWRENFMMSYMVVEAQARARRYLNVVGCLTQRRLRVGGHSKGGNLAAFAAANCSSRIEPRIMELWCNDSPGFVREVVDFSGFDIIADRARLFVPEFCVVAGIMEQAFAPTVIRSQGSRYLQHDLMNWQIEDGALMRGTAINPACRRVGRVFHWLVYSHSRSARVAIVNELFDALSKAGIVRIYDFTGKGPSVFARLAAQFSKCGKLTRSAVAGVLGPIARIETGAALLRAYARTAHRLALAINA